MFKTDWLGGTSNVNNIGVSIPAVNIKESDDNFLVEVAAPGKSKEDFNIELDNDVLTISAEEKKENKEEENGKFTRREFSYRTFKRAFSLPEMVETTKINASYEQGVLLIALPKKEEAKVQAKRMIEIS
jgi:HSP20 family protein